MTEWLRRPRPATDCRRSSARSSTGRRARGRWRRRWAAAKRRRGFLGCKRPQSHAHLVCSLAATVARRREDDCALSPPLGSAEGQAPDGGAAAEAGGQGEGVRGAEGRGRGRGRQRRGVVVTVRVGFFPAIMAYRHHHQAAMVVVVARVWRLLPLQRGGAAEDRDRRSRRTKTEEVFCLFDTSSERARPAAAREGGERAIIDARVLVAR